MPQPANIFTSVKQYFFPTHAIGRMSNRQDQDGPVPKTQQFVKEASKPLDTRSLEQQRVESGESRVNTASDPFSFDTRFKFLVFSVRLKFTSSLAGLETLKKEVHSFKKELKSGAKSPSALKFPATVKALAIMEASIDRKLVHVDPKKSIPANDGPRCQGW
jgi:hypothetical protein